MTPMRLLRVRPNRRAHGGLDHFDHGDAVALLEPLAGIPKHRGTRGVARDDEQLDALVDELIHDA